MRRRLFLLLLGSILVAPIARSARSDSLLLDSPPERVIISPDDFEIYISNEGTDSITVIYTEWWSSILKMVGLGGPSVIQVMKRPGPMFFSRDGSLLFVGNCGGFEFNQGNPLTIPGSVSVINTATKKVIATIPVGGELVPPSGSCDSALREGTKVV